MTVTTEDGLTTLKCDVCGKIIKQPVPLIDMNRHEIETNYCGKHKDKAKRKEYNEEQ